MFCGTVTNRTKQLMAYILPQLDKVFIFYLSFVDSMALNKQIIESFVLPAAVTRLT